MAKSAKMLYSLDNSHVASLPGEKKKNWSVIRKSLENLIFGTPVGVEVQIEKFVVYCGILWYIFSKNMFGCLGRFKVFYCSIHALLTSLYLKQVLSSLH